MNDAEFFAQVARLLALAEQWVRPIGLGWWRIDLTYDRTGEDFADAKQQSGNFYSTSLARCYADWRYGLATIVWNMPEVARKTNDELEHAFVHELMHCYLHELRGDDDSDDHPDHEEHAATSLEKAFIWIRDRARDGEWGKVDDA